MSGGTIKPFRSIQTQDRVLNMVQDNIAAIISTLNLNPLIFGKTVKQVKFAAGDNTVSHGLGRNFVSCLVAIPTTAAFSGTFGSGVGLSVSAMQTDPSRWIVINATAACVADLYVY